MAQNNQRDPNLRAKTVARVNQLLKGGLTKAGAFEKISAETGRAKDAVQMLYYRAVRASKAGAKAAVKAVATSPAPKGAAPKTGAPKAAAPKASAPAAPAAPVTAAKAVAVPASRPSRRRRRSSRRASKNATPKTPEVAQSGEFPKLLNGIASAINALLKHVEKTVTDNKRLREQAERLQAITSLIRGR